MKMNRFLLPIALFSTFFAHSQERIPYDHCNCVDIIDTLSPSPNGKYTRNCNSSIIESGHFSNGLKIGEWLSYAVNGNMIKKINYYEGVLDGEVQYFYNNGKKKLTGMFSNGLKTGEWQFYNEKEKTQWSLTFEQGSPIGKSLIYDKKGKKVMISFDYDRNEYDIINSDFSLFPENAEVLQDATSSEWFVLVLTDPTTKNIALGLDQKNIESELFMSLVEIPSEIFNTYLNVNYNASLTFENGALKTVNLKREIALGEKYPLFAFGVATNDPDKLHSIEHSEFSLMLLDSKIKEALMIFTPWQIESGEFNMAFIYVINQIEGREHSIDRY